MSLREDLLDGIINGKIGRGLVVTRKEFVEYFARSQYSEKYISSFLSDSELGSKHSTSYEKFTMQVEEGKYCIDPFAVFQRMKDRGMIKK